MKERAKVFISYSHDSDEHRQRVLSLANRLRQEGVDVSIDQYLNGPPREGWPNWMLNRLDWAEVVLLICTETYYRRFRGQEQPGMGKGVAWEGTIITNEIYEARCQTLKFIPVISSPDHGAFVPDVLRGYSQLLDSEEAYGKLYRFLTDQPLSVAPPVGAVVVKPKADVPPLTWPSTTARLELLPRAHSDFVGRVEDLEQLHAFFNGQSRVFLLHGPPGNGKSTLALKFVWEAGDKFDALIFQPCGQRSVDTICAELGAKLGLDLSRLKPEFQLAAVKDGLAARRSLVILDDVWNADILNLIPNPPASVLCTSRQKTWPWIAASDRRAVEAFSTTDALALFAKHLGKETTERHREDLLALAIKFGFSPIAIAVAASLLQQHCDPIGEQAQNLALEQLCNEIHDVPGLLKKAFESQTPEDQMLIEAIAVCAPDAVWLPLAFEIAGLNLAQGKTARDRLVKGSLLQEVDRDRQYYRLHALLRDRLHTCSHRSELQPRHAATIERRFQNWEIKWEDCGNCLAEVLPALRWLWQADETERFNQLAYNGFALGRRIGELLWAQKILMEEEKSWAARPVVAAKSNLQRSYGNQAVILQIWGHLDEAMALHKKQEAQSLELGNKDGLQFSYGNQALILQAWDRLDEAMILHKKQETLCLELGNKDGLQMSYSNQASILYAWGRFDEALALLKKQETLSLELGNKDGLQRSFGNQALILRDWGHLDEAMALHKKKEILCLELGNKNDLQIGYGNQALILQAWGRLDEAMILHKKQESLCLELGNKECLQRSYGNQASILQAWSRLDEAMALLKKQESLCLELGIKSNLAYCYWNWGLLTQKQIQSTLAREKLQAALAIFTDLKMPRERAAVQSALDNIPNPN